MDRIKPIQNENHTCMNCLSEGGINTIDIGALGYGSGFDGWSTKLKLCDKCYKNTNANWWEFRVIQDGYCEEYEYEKSIFDYIDSLPLEGKELFYNRFTYGWNAYRMEPQDWIDYNLNILPHEKCKEYQLHSYQEKQAYKERFPTCNKVFKKVFNDGSVGCYCDRGASGNKDGNCGFNISDECYLCPDYIPKNTK